MMASMLPFPDLHNSHSRSDMPMSNNGAFAQDPRYFPGGQSMASAPSQSSSLVTSQPQELASRLIFMDSEGPGSVPSLDNFVNKGVDRVLQAVFGVMLAGQAVGSEPNVCEEFEEVVGQVPQNLNTYILQDHTYNIRKFIFILRQSLDQGPKEH
jgi:hypothetical protein